MCLICYKEFGFESKCFFFFFNLKFYSFLNLYRSLTQILPMHDEPLLMNWFITTNLEFKFFFLSKKKKNHVIYLFIYFLIVPILILERKNPTFRNGREEANRNNDRQYSRNGYRRTPVRIETSGQGKRFTVYTVWRRLV